MRTGKGRGYHKPLIRNPCSGGGPRAVTPAGPCEWGQQQLILHTGVGKLSWVMLGELGNPLWTELGSPCVWDGNSPKAPPAPAGSAHCCFQSGGKGKERGKKKKKGLSILWEHPEFLLLPRLLQCPFLQQGGMQHYLPESLLPSHPSPCPSLTC